METQKKIKAQNRYISGIACAVLNCGVTKRSHPDRKLFNFPSRSNKNLFEIWAEKCGVHESRFNRKLKICNVHFRSEDKGKGRLKRTAIPEFNLPLCVNGVYKNQSVNKPEKIFFCTWPNCCEIFNCMEKFKMHLTIHKDKTLNEIEHEPDQNLENDVLHPDIKQESDVPDIIASVPDLNKEIKTELVDEYEEHQTDEFNPPLFTCNWDSCGETFDTLDILEKHTVTHSESKHNNLRSSKNVIDDESTAQQNPRTRKLSESSSSRFKRQKCTCSNCSNNKHNTETPTKHICDFEGCGRVFPKSSNLSRHVQMIHSNVQPFSCDFENCGKSFKLPADHGSDSNVSIDKNCTFSSSSSCSSMSQDLSMQIKTESLDEYGEYEILE